MAAIRPSLSNERNSSRMLIKTSRRAFWIFPCGNGRRVYTCSLQPPGRHGVSYQKIFLLFLKRCHKSDLPRFYTRGIIYKPLPRLLPKRLRHTWLEYKRRGTSMSVAGKKFVKLDCQGVAADAS